MYLFLKGARAFFGKSKKREKSFIKAEVTDEEKAESELENSSTRDNPVVDKIQHEMTDDKKKKPKHKGKLFVGGLNHSTTSTGLKDYFSRFGTVIDAVVVKHPNTKKSRGFGFVTFLDPDDAEKTLQTEVHIVDEKEVECRPFVCRDESKRTESGKPRVFLGGLPASVTKADLREFFSRYGEVENVHIPLDGLSNQGKGFAILSFKDEAVAEKCIADRFVHLNGRRIFINKANPPGTGLNGEVWGSDDLTLLDSESSGPADSTFTDTLSASSGQDLDFEQYPELEQALRMVLREKFAHLSGMNEEKVDLETDIEAVEKFLKGLLVNRDGDSAQESRDEDISTGEDDYGDIGSCPSPRAEFDENAVVFSRVQSASDEGMPREKGQSNVELSAQNRGDFKASFTDLDGNYICSLCGWKSSKPSLKNFLAHCKSAPHRTKIRERFPEFAIQELKPEPTLCPNSEKPRYSQSELRSYPTVIGSQKEHSEKHNKTQNAQKTGKIQQISPNLEQQQGAPECPQQRQPAEKQFKEIKRFEKKEKGQMKEGKKQNDTKKHPKEELNPKTKAKQKSQDGKQKSCPVTENQCINNKNLKVCALSSGMACIQPLPNGTLNCEMCNKVIPRASDFGVLMKNATQHLQSKGHLQNLLKTEDELRSLISKYQEKRQARSVENESSEEKDLKNKKKMATAKKVETPKAPDQKTASEPTVGVPKNPVPTAKDPKAQNVQTNPKGKTGKKNSEKANDSKMTFLCLRCNTSNAGVDELNRHLNSKPHRRASTGDENLTADVVQGTECEFCHVFLVGSLFEKEVDRS